MTVRELVLKLTELDPENRVMLHWPDDLDNEDYVEVLNVEEATGGEEDLVILWP